MADAAPHAVVTPWRTVLLLEPTHVPVGVPIDPALALVSACAGKPGCAKALADVRADTRSALAAGTLPQGRVHVSGCARRCGAPRGEHIEFVAGARYL
jgi:precorrin-3B synthase